MGGNTLKYISDAKHSKCIFTQSTNTQFIHINQMIHNSFMYAIRLTPRLNACGNIFVDIIVMLLIFIHSLQFFFEISSSLNQKSSLIPSYEPITRHFSTRHT